MESPLTFETTTPDEKNLLKKVVPAIKKIANVAEKVNNVTGKIIIVASVL
jgi:hypothetical protein